MNDRIDDPDTLLVGLTPEQRDAVTTSASPLCIIAGAGSGKTRVLTHRIAWQASSGHIDPRRVLAVTFTRKAAAELRRRTRRLGIRDEIAAGTFHSAALAMLRRHWEANDRSAPELLTNRRAFLAKHNPRLDRSTVADLDIEIGWARARLITPERYPDAAVKSQRRPTRGREFVAKAYADFEVTKRRRRLVDFDDLLALCHATLQRDKTFADAQKWRHRHLFVDEFQDVNPLQFALLKSWLDPTSTLTVVGDPDQAIYGWNGAEPDLIREIGRHLNGTAVIHLRTNFRSTPEILEAAGRVLGREPQPAARPSGSLPDITVLDGPDEARSLASAVRGSHRPGSPWNRQAVLARTNAQLIPIGRALERAGIPTRTRGDSAILRRPEIVDLIGGWDDRALLSKVLADELTELKFDPDTERGVMIEIFLDMVRDHLALEPASTVDDLVTILRNDDQTSTTGDAVELVTFHSSKGLEWPVVHLIGLEEGFVPISFAKSRAAIEEERRLLHVATTRAESELHIYWCRRRARGDKLDPRVPSPWLDAFQFDEPATVEAPPHLDEIRSRLDDETITESPDPAADRDELTRERLVAWRRSMAKAAKVDPAAILADEVMERCVRERPTTLTQLEDPTLLGSGRTRRWGKTVLELIEPGTTER